MTKEEIKSAGVLTRGGIEIINKKPQYTKREKEALERVFKFDSLDNITFHDSGFLLKADSNESMFLKEALVSIVKEALVKLYSSMTARTIFSVKNHGNPGATSLLYVIKDYIARARLAGVKTTSMSKANINQTPYYSPVFNLELDAEWTLYEIESAIFANVPLVSEYLLATKQGHERAFDEICFGISEYPEEQLIPGLLNQSGSVIKNTDLVGSASEDYLVDYNILTGSATDNYDYLINAINTPFNFSEVNEAIPDTLVMPIAQVNKIMTQKYSNVLGDTVAKNIFENTTIKRIIAAPELKKGTTVNTTGDKLLIGSTQNNDVAEIVTTRNFTVLPAKVDRTKTTLTTLSGLGGLFIYRKLFAVVDNCGA